MYYKENELAIKSVKERVIQGTGVRFGSPESADIDREWFSEKSDVGLVNGTNRPYLLEHGWSPISGKAVVAIATFEKKAAGWEYEAVFNDNEIGDKAYNELISKPYRSSAGAAGHTRSATLVKGTFHLDTWLIAEQSATLRPADSENPQLVRIKNDPIEFMRDEVQRMNQEFINQFLDAVSKSASESRDKLADTLLQLKDSFVNEQKTAPPITTEFLETLEQVVKPIHLIQLD